MTAPRKPRALKGLTPAERSQAVVDQYAGVLRTGTQFARVTYQRILAETRRYYLVGVGSNATRTGTQEALIVREPSANSHDLQFIPYTQLIRIEPDQP